ncbi:MAG: hypothetical protein E6Q97_31335 [Desulfurellales bacterium]|nr:MAG: hypothetical protein E6Q97_31335 [Desulfurellales bacterium]
MPASKRRGAKYLHTYRSRGRTFYYFRRAGANVRLHGDPSSPAFWEQYSQLLRDTEPERKATAPERIQAGSIAALIRTFQAAPEWRAKGKGAQEYYRRAFRSLDRIETQPANALARRHVLRIRDEIAATSPTVADRFIICVRTLYAFAIDREFGIGPRRVTANPCAGIKRIAKGGSREAWTDEQHATFESHAHPEGILTGYLIATYTGQRLGDVIALRPQDYDGKRLHLTQQKTGRQLVIPAHARLKRHLDSLPHDGRQTFVLTTLGRPFSKTGFSEAFGMATARVGLKGMTFHGLRHSTGKRLAEAGCSTHEIQAILGHTTLANTELYTSAASQERLAREAIRKLEGRRK